MKLFAYARNTWRTLTSMGTALVLLFLLALAAIPGALLPQRSLNESKVAQYLAEHPTIGPWLDRLQAFDVFSSFWFTAIYVLLFVSLVGCLTPRLAEHVRSLRAQPVAAPRNLSRLPKHHSAQVPGDDIGAMTAVVDGRLSGWRRFTRETADGAEISGLDRHLPRYAEGAPLCGCGGAGGTSLAARPRAAPPGPTRPRSEHPTCHQPPTSRARLDGASAASPSSSPGSWRSSSRPVTSPGRRAPPTG